MDRIVLLLALLLALPSTAFATWSVIAVDRGTGRVVIASATCVDRDDQFLMGVQAVVVPGKGVAACQAGVDQTKKNQMLVFQELQKGTDPKTIIELLSEDPVYQSRQFGILDLQGRGAGHSGLSNGYVSQDIQGQVPGTEIFYSIQGNILRAGQVVPNAVQAFINTNGAITDRVMAAMEAADGSGGDSRCLCPPWPSDGSKPKFACDVRTSHVGEQISPALSWTNAPENAASFVLIMHDVDAATGNGTDDVLHWMLWNIPPTTKALAEGIAQGSQLPDGTRQISVSGPYYRGPGAPASGPAHHYVFELFALDTMLDVPAVGSSPQQTRAAVVAAMAGHVRGKAAYTGLFKRSMPTTSSLQAAYMTPKDRTDLIELLQKSEAEFMMAVEKLTDQQWSFKPAADRWSVAEVAEHIVLADALLFDTARNALRAPQTAEWQALEKKTELIKQAIPNRSRKVDAPGAIQPKKTVTRAEVMARFKEGRARMMAFAREVDGPLKAHAADNPFFGPLNVYQWLIYAPLHNLRHNQQIDEVKAAAGFPR